MNARFSPFGDNLKDDFAGFLKKSFIGISGGGSVCGVQLNIKIDNKLNIKIETI
jgi:hypothetical protein